MKIATFNINGVKARLPALLDWLEEAAPDVAALQEIKCEDAAFPAEAFEERGWNLAVHGQKAFNGVALLSKRPLEDVSLGLPGDESDDQARWIEATVMGEAEAVRVCGLYLPNGNPAPGPKYAYKLAWMARLEARARALLAEERPAALLGDYNVIPEPRDCHDPKAWEGDALFLPETRAAFRRILHLGFTEAWRALKAEDAYTFWDYQGGAWRKNHGVRIDHALLTPQAADRLRRVGIDSHVRGREKASDHVPLWIELEV